jgi:hypothetical protein
MTARILDLTLRACLVPALLVPTACSKAVPDAAAAPAKVAAVDLPVAPEARAMTCYAAQVVNWDAQGHDKALSDEDANRAAHFILLGASTGGVTQASKITELPARAGPIKTSLRQADRAEATGQACAAAFPMTVRGSLKPLGPDSRDVRVQCFALAWAMTQIYANSPTVSGPRIARARRLSDVLDEQLSRDFESGAAPSEAEIAAVTMRGLATAVEQGPVSEMIDSCAGRYAPDRA